MFMIRIELHRETNYEPLHDAMAARSMKRYIKGGDGTVYRLPTGVYHYAGSATAESVRTSTAEAARAVGHVAPSIMVADASKIAWSGLDALDGYKAIYAAMGL